MNADRFKRNMDKTTFFSLLPFLVIVFVSFTLASPNRNKGVQMDEEGRPKRTFCNAFTGCGRKRSNGLGQAQQQRLDDGGGMGGGDYGGGEDDDEGVEELARDILAEARLWEAFQARNPVKSSQNKDQWRSKGGYRGGNRRLTPTEEISN